MGSRSTLPGPGWFEDNCGSFEWRYPSQLPTGERWHEEQDDDNEGKSSEDDDSADSDCPGRDPMRGDGDCNVLLRKRRRSLSPSSKTYATASQRCCAASEARAKAGKRTVSAVIAAAEQEPAMSLATELSRCTSIELQGYLRDAGLRATGLKADLVERVKVRSHT